MTWDPETDDPAAVRRRQEREASDVGDDTGSDIRDEAASALRDRGPYQLAPIDPNAPVSGHVPATGAPVPINETPEHDWGHAAEVVYPAFRPVGTQGVRLDGLDPEALSALTGRGHATPLVYEGPCDLAVVYALGATGFDIIVNAEHLLSWGIETAGLQDAAMRNLAKWSATAAWTDEVSGDRRLLSSDTGDGWDAVRILLPEVREHLGRELGASGRVLVGLPERHLLVAGTLRPDDDEFAALFADFIVEHSGGADEPVDRRLLELVDGRLVAFAGPPA